MKPADIQSSTYIDSSKVINHKHPISKTGGITRISKYKNISAKGSAPNWSEEDFVIEKVKNTEQLTYVISYLKDRETVGTFYKK